MKEDLEIVGNVELTLIKSSGDTTAIKVKNLIVTTGKNWITSRIIGSVSTPMSNMAIGSGASIQTVTNTELQNESSRVMLTTNSLNNYITYFATFPPGAGVGEITEAGIFNSAISGIMLCRTTFPAINKDVQDTLTITWTITTL